MDRRTLLTGLASTSILAACGVPQPRTERGTLIIVRHTERTEENLNAEGIARAAALPAALEGMQIDGIYAPDRQRNIDTAMPLAEARGLEVQIITATNIAQKLFKRQPGGTLVWVGNKDNISELWDEIGATGDAPTQYGDLFVVTMNGLNADRVERLHFGA